MEFVVGGGGGGGGGQIELPKNLGGGEAIQYGSGNLQRRMHGGGIGSNVMCGCWGGVHTSCRVWGMLPR